MKERLIFLWNEFCMISTCVLTATALFTTLLSPEDSISPNTLWQVLFVSLLCTLSTLLYPWKRNIKKMGFYIRVATHYLLINAIVLSFGSRFNWYHPTHLKSTLSMLLSIAIIFAAVSFISWSHSAKDAKKMNERLEKYQETLSPEDIEK